MNPTLSRWGELSCPDIELAQQFYGAIFGWEHKAEDWFLPGVEGNVGGWVPVGENVRPEWLVHFAVADADATAARAVDLGGGVVVASADIPGRGRVARLEDPQGANFAIVERDF